jgi:hypothetical protein
MALFLEESCVELVFRCVECGVTRFNTSDHSCDCPSTLNSSVFTDGSVVVNDIIIDDDINSDMERYISLLPTDEKEEIEEFFSSH